MGDRFLRSVDDVYASRVRLGLLSVDCSSVGDGEAKERDQFRFAPRQVGLRAIGWVSVGARVFQVFR